MVSRSLIAAVTPFEAFEPLPLFAAPCAALYLRHFCAHGGLLLSVGVLYQTCLFSRETMGLARRFVLTACLALTFCLRLLRLETLPLLRCLCPLVCARALAWTGWEWMRWNDCTRGLEGQQVRTYDICAPQVYNAGMASRIHDDNVSCYSDRLCLRAASRVLPGSGNSLKVVNIEVSSC